MTLRASYRALSVTAAAVLSAAAVSTGIAAGEDFRIENKVFVADEKEARIESTTIFHGGVVYDYLVDPAEVTVFDKDHGRFVLLDMTRRIKTELTTERVASFTQDLKRWTEDQSDPFRKFLGDPHFEEEFDADAGQLTFASPWMTYRLTTVDVESEALSRQYREFCDWHCRLNTLLNPGASPPFARMLVNAALDQRRRFPRQVELTIRPKEGLLAKRVTFRSEHLLTRQLVESDRKRVAQTDQLMAMYSAVVFQEYQRKMAD